MFLYACRRDFVSDGGGRTLLTILPFLFLYACQRDFVSDGRRRKGLG